MAFGHGPFHMPKIWRNPHRTRIGGFTQLPNTLEAQHWRYNLTDKTSVMSYHAVVDVTGEKMLAHYENTTHSLEVNPLHRRVIGPKHLPGQGHSALQTSIWSWQVPKAGLGPTIQGPRPFQASCIIELKDSINSCSKALLRHVVLDLPCCITVYLRLYPQLLFLCLSTYTQTFPPYWGVLVLASVLV